MIPCDKQWLGRGPMEDVTTHKHDYSWKSMTRPEVIKIENNLYPPCAALSGNPHTHTHTHTHTRARARARAHTLLDINIYLL